MPHAILSKLLSTIDPIDLPSVAPAHKNVAPEFNLAGIAPRQQPKVRVEDPRDLESTKKVGGSYRQDIIQDIISSAKDMGINPNLALAVGIQESGLDSAANPLGTNQFVGDEVLNLLPTDHSTDAEDTVVRGHLISKALNYLQKQLVKNPDNLERGIQGYNGYGRLHPNSAKAYGQLAGDLPENFYGKRILDLQHNVVEPSGVLQALIKRASSSE